MQNLPDRSVIFVVISGKIISPHMSKIWISVHHGRRFIDCFTLESAVVGFRGSTGVRP